MKSTLITVIPVYNGERYLAETLESVAAQTRRPDRLIVLDNCSTDRTQEIVESFKPIICEWRRNETNLGLFGNMNRALEWAAQTDYLHLLHADDRIHAGFYSDYLAALVSVDGRALAFSHPEFIDADGQQASGPRLPPVLSPTLIPVKQFLVSRVELQPIYFPAVLLKTARQPAPCQFRLDLPQLADHVFWAEWASHSTQILQLPEGLAQYRLHSQSGTGGNAASLKAWVLDEWKTMQLILPMIREKGGRSWLRQQKLSCLFAARSQVKMRQITGSNPDFANEIRRASRAIVSPWHWSAAALTVWLRRVLAR